MVLPQTKYILIPHHAMPQIINNLMFVIQVCLLDGLGFEFVHWKDGYGRKQPPEDHHRETNLAKWSDNLLRG